MSAIHERPESVKNGPSRRRAGRSCFLGTVRSLTAERMAEICQEPTLGDRIPLASVHSGSTRRGKNFGLGVIGTRLDAERRHSQRARQCKLALIARCSWRFLIATACAVEERTVYPTLS